MNGTIDTNPNSTSDTALSVRGITKYYGEFAANCDVDFDLRHGEIHALLGENGAGKSTLVKMLYGALQPSAGEISINGATTKITSPAKARHLGIGMVFQHFSLFEALSVSENIALALDGKVSLSKVRAQALELSSKYGLPVKPDALVGELSVGERQRVEIIRCLLQEPSIIILDEPTSVLTPQESEKLFETLTILKQEGRALLFISHRLEEVRKHCDRATILRHGVVVESCDPRAETTASMASMMVGTALPEVKRTADPNITTPLVEIENLSLPTNQPFGVSLKNISAFFNKGEIFGIAGIAGNGMAELFQALSGERIAGLDRSIRLTGRPIGKFNINQRRKLSCGFVPEERLGHAAVSEFTLSNNLLLARHASDAEHFLKGTGIILRDRLAQATRRICEAMDVRKAKADPVANTLSGGNLQKFIIGRELDRQPEFLVINQPSWGVDAGAAGRIRQALIDLANKGSAIVVISQDLDEILEISDRVAVMFDGQLSEPLPINELDRETIGLKMAGIGVVQNTGDSARAA